MDVIPFLIELNQEFRRDAVDTDLQLPWFGQFVLDLGDRKQGYKLGDARFAVHGIIDWRHPLASAFYELDPGEEFDLADYAEEEGYAELNGKVQRQTQVSARNRSIQRAVIKTETEHLSYVAQGEGFELEPLDGDRLRFMDRLPDVRSVLTKEQYRLITSTSGSPVVIQGQAGSGKTTVALYRLSWLSFPKAEAPVVDPQNVLIVMFNKALQRFVSGSLGELGLEQAKVSTFHAWALEEVRKSYEGRLELNTDALEHKDTAVRVKKGLGMLNALEEFVGRQTERLEQWLGAKLEPYDAQAWLDALHQGQEPIVQRMLRLRKQARQERDRAQGREKARMEQIYDVFKKGVSRLTLYKEELLNFLTDQDLLSKHLPFESEETLEQLAAYQRALQGIGRTERRPGPHIAFEDLALLLRLIQLKNGGLVDKQDAEQVNLYDHLVIDEAQDFGGLELKVLLAAVRSRSGVTIVGDTNQKIVPEAEFIGWDALVSELGVSGAQVTQLQIGHRSTGPIMELAAQLIDEKPSKGRPGAKPQLVESKNFAEQMDRLAERLAQLQSGEPTGHACVVCRHASQVDEIKRQLEQRLPHARLRKGHNKDFDFSAGITVTNLRQVKGLEFDQVFLLEPSEAHYPNNPEGRRNLYTALTRAKDELAFLCTEPPSSLLTSALKADLLERTAPESVEPVRFDEEDEEPF